MTMKSSCIRFLFGRLHCLSLSMQVRRSSVICCSVGVPPSRSTALLRKHHPAARSRLAIPSARSTIASISSGRSTGLSAHILITILPRTLVVRMPAVFEDTNSELIAAFMASSYSSALPSGTYRKVKIARLVDEELTICQSGRLRSFASAASASTNP